MLVISSLERLFLSRISKRRFSFIVNNGREDKILFLLHIYNDRIVKTDKCFYEVVNYSEQNKTIPTTMKINLLSKYYDEVLSFTYEYVILKDYTLIPINDIFVSRPKEYQTYFYVDSFDEKPELFEE